MSRRNASSRTRSRKASRRTTMSSSESWKAEVPAQEDLIRLTLDERGWEAPWVVPTPFFFSRSRTAPKRSGHVDVEVKGLFATPVSCK